MLFFVPKFQNCSNPLPSYRITLKKKYCLYLYTYVYVHVNQIFYLLYFMPTFCSGKPTCLKYTFSILIRFRKFLSIAVGTFIIFFTNWNTALAIQIWINRIIKIIHPYFATCKDMSISFSTDLLFFFTQSRNI